MRKIVATLTLICACNASFADTSGDWTYTVSNNEATITGYTGAGGAVTIPSVLGGYAVKKVGSGGFPPWLVSVFGYPNSSVTSITIPNSVTSIGDYAFSNCTGLTGTLTIPNSVTSIGYGAFSGCTGLTTLTIPNSVTSIESSTFFGCTGLTTLTIPSSVTSIGGSAFLGCTGLTTLTIPSSVTSIGENAFGGCTGLTTLTMPFRFNTQIDRIGISGEVAFDYLVNALANNDAFVTAVANKIKGTGGNYGIATQSGLSSAIEPLATKTQITTAINEGRAAGIASVTASPNTWSLFTSSQIQNMAIGDLVLTREVNGNFVLNYDIEQSNDLANWTVYSANTQIVKLPADKAFVRIKAKQDGASNVSNSQTTPTTPTFGSSYDGGSGVSPNYATPNYSGGASAISPSPGWLNSLPSVPLGPIEEE